MSRRSKVQKNLSGRKQKNIRKWKCCLALLLTFFVVAAGNLGTALGETGSSEPVLAGISEISEMESANLLAFQELSYPTGGLIRDAWEVSQEECSDELPIYGNYAIFSLDGARDDLYTIQEARYGYEHLDENQQKFYIACLNGIINFLAGDYNTRDFTSDKDTEILFGVDFASYNLRREDASAAYYCLRNDYPEFYWLWYGFSYDNRNIYIVLGEEYYEAEERVRVEQAIDQGINEYLAAVEGMTDSYEIIRTVHDKLIEDVEYANQANGQPENALWAHSIAGVFNGESAVVCEGYAKTLQYVLNRLEIDNIYMTGLAGGEAHAWNGVKIGEEWFYLDATWDDAGANYFEENGLFYIYFCTPASIFTKNHKVDKPNAKDNWLYEIPQMSESNEYTFYSRYNCDFTKVRSTEEAKDQLLLAGKSVPGQYIHALVNDNTKNYLSAANGGLEKGIKAPDGNVVFFIDATKYKAAFPATEILLSETMVELDRDQSETAVLTAVLTSAAGDCDDVVQWSSSSNCVEIIPEADGTSATLIGKRNGTAVITATAVAGRVSVSCIVTVIGTAEYENIYLDASFATVPTEDDFMLWINGSNVKTAENIRYNYKMRSFYTDIEASPITTVDSRGRTKTKNGKLVAGITLSAEEPVLVKGKIVDSEAAKIAKATVNARTGLVKVTAQKQTGEVYLWVIDTGDAHAVAYAKLTVTAAPSKILLNDKDYETGSRTVVKKQTLALGENMQVFLEPLLSSRGTEIAQGGSYSVTFSKNGEKYIKVEPIDGLKYGYQITPIALDAAKQGKTLNVRINFVCNENNKKTSINITITNPMEHLTFAAGTGLTMTAEDTFTVKYSETQTQNLVLDFTALQKNILNATTDKPKLSAVSDRSGISINEKGKLLVTKPTGDAAKLRASFSRDKKSIVIKVPKKLAIGTKNYFVLYYNKDCYRVCSVEVVE